MTDIRTLPVLPLRDIVVFPHMVVPLFVGRDKSVRALEEVMRADKQILLATQKNSADDDPATDDIYDVGVIATVLLAAKYEQLAMVVLGTTLGMLLANVPVVALGARFAHRLPLKAARYAAAVVFAVLAVLVLVQAGTG